jgi:cytochrome c biogenesis protein CcdA
MNIANKRLYQYLFLLLGIMLLALAGYSGYVLYPRFDLPAATGIGLLALAVVAGIASLFSPCSFPLLMTLLAREVEGDDGRSTRAFRFAGVFALGATLFLLLTGATLALGAAPIFARITFTSTAGRILRAVVGLVLIALGLWQLGGQSLNIGWLNELLQPLWQAQARLRRERSTLGVGLYGFGYVLAGFG